MYVSATATGTQTTVITTEHTLNSPAVAGRFQLIVDTSVMVAGDVLELRAKQIVLTGGTLRVVNFAQFSGAQPTDDMIKVLDIVGNELVEAGAVSFTMKQTFGTVHAYPWKVLNLTTTPANISALSIDSSGRVDVIKLASQTVTAAAGVTFPSSVASPTNITAGTITTVTNLTNAPTNGDLTATMKTSVTTAATAATPIAASVTGAVGSVTAGVTVTTNNDKTGYGLSAAGVQAIWDALTSALTTAGSVGKRIADNLDVVLSTRLASSGYTAPLDAAGTRTAVGLASANLDTQLGAIASYIDTDVAAIKAQTDLIPASPAAVGSAMTLASGSITAAVVATGAIDADALATDAVNEIADGLLNRDMSTGTDSGSTTVRTVRQALRFLRNKWSISGTTLTVTKEDDSTASWTATLTTDATVDPVTGSDPA